jgi:hypothetical protein
MVFSSADAGAATLSANTNTQSKTLPPFLLASTPLHRAASSFIHHRFGPVRCRRLAV